MSELNAIMPAQAFFGPGQKVIRFDQLALLREKLSNQCIVHCHGVFDVLHAGHLAYFKSAKTFGDVVVVTITADQFVNKGPGRPYFNSTVRASMVAALEIVDFVAINNTPTAVPAIEKLKPNFYVKGPDYKDKGSDPTGAIFDEENMVTKMGGRLVFTNDETLSSSKVINDFFNPWSDHQQKTLEIAKRMGGLEVALAALERLEKMQIVCVGEPIVDTYVFCQPESISTKSPSISAKYLFQEDYAGGILAIANHACGFVEKVTLLTQSGGEEYFSKLLTAKVDPRIEKRIVELSGAPTPRKTRFIEVNRSQRMFEITDLKSDQWSYNSSKGLVKELFSTNKEVAATEGATIVADFGHGMFEKEPLAACSDLQGFVALNVQTNSSNFGFNPFTKHKKFSYLSIDVQEAKIAYHDRFSNGVTLAKKLRDTLQPLGAAFSLTLGAQGSIYYPNGSDSGIESPAFSDVVIDATGAGDAYFVMSSLLTKSKCPDFFIPFISNIFAGLKTKIIGNKSSVTKAQLTKALTAVLR